MLLQDLNLHILDTDRVTTQTKREVIVKYIHRSLRTHNSYVYKFVFCEFLNLANICGQMYLMDVFFNGYFSTYGLDVLSSLQLEDEIREDVMVTIFPRITKCKCCVLLIFQLKGVNLKMSQLDGRTAYISERSRNLK